MLGIDLWWTSILGERHGGGPPTENGILQTNSPDSFIMACDGISFILQAG